jgi:hypothetical protein
MSEPGVSAAKPPTALRMAVARDLTAVRPLAAPGMRALVVLPLGFLVLVAAPLAFDLRADAPRLGWLWTWGASLVQLVAGMALVAAALREAVPGRSWPKSRLFGWVLLPVVLVVATTFGTDAASPTVLRGPWWTVGAMCFVESVASGLPMVLLAGLLASRAYVTRPIVTGLLLGLGAGLMADAGWRLFCHFSQPDHVLTAHLASILACGFAGALGLRAAQRLSLR